MEMEKEEKRVINGGIVAGSQKYIQLKTYRRIMWCEKEITEILIELLKLRRIVNQIISRQESVEIKS